ncbi:MAG: hypothetical protein E2O76_03390, partial [Caldithrix sp.]
MKSILSVTTGLLLLATTLLAQVPQTISYQGVLTDTDGNVVQDGNYKLTFRLYSSPDNSALLWEESQDNISVQAGLFNVILGSITPLDLPFDQPYFLTISVNDGEELSPRIELTSSAYSLNARSVTDSSVTGKKIADGQVVRALKILGPDGSRIATLTDSVKLRAGNNISFDVDGFTGEVSISASGQVAESRNALDAADGDPTDVVFVDEDGKVGIGTTAPTQQLEITGNLQLPHTSVSAGDSVGIIMVDGKRFIHNFGSFNFFAGENAGNLTMTGIDNMASGAFALFRNTTGSENTASGVEALSSNTTGNFNTASGANALRRNTGGFSNTASGVGALFSNTMGDFNTASGADALSSNTTGNNNTASGTNALFSNTTGGFNTASGLTALPSNTTGNSNTAYGVGALLLNTTGFLNTAIGRDAGVSDENFHNTTAIGANARVDASNKIRLGDNNVTTVET